MFSAQPSLASPRFAFLLSAYVLGLPPSFDHRGWPHISSHFGTLFCALSLFCTRVKRIPFTSNRLRTLACNTRGTPPSSNRLCPGLFRPGGVLPRRKKISQMARAPQVVGRFTCRARDFSSGVAEMVSPPPGAMLSQKWYEEQQTKRQKQKAGWLRRRSRALAGAGMRIAQFRGDRIRAEEIDEVRGIRRRGERNKRSVLHEKVGLVLRIGRKARSKTRGTCCGRGAETHAIGTGKDCRWQRSSQAKCVLHCGIERNRGTCRRSLLLRERAGIAGAIRIDRKRSCRRRDTQKTSRRCEETKPFHNTTTFH